MDGNQAVQYLDSLIGRTLRVHATDTRIFVGTFKCTDAVGAFCYEFPFQHLFFCLDSSEGYENQEYEKEHKLAPADLFWPH